MSLSNLKIPQSKRVSLRLVPIYDPKIKRAIIGSIDRYRIIRYDKTLEKVFAVFFHFIIDAYNIGTL
jgi:hypothetical protein